MALTEGLVRQRLMNQRLVGARFERASDVVRWIGAVQAQDYHGAKWAVGQRMTAATDSGLDASFNEGELPRTHMMRPTWHLVAPEDIRWMLALTAPRVHALNASMYRNLELDPFVDIDSEVQVALNAALATYGAFLGRTVVIG